IIEDREKKLHPHIEIIQKKGEKEKRLRDFVIPEGAQLTVEDGQEVYAGLVLAKVSREAYKTRDITGGLPRVAELFEARRPKDPATISEVDGTVRFGEIKRGKREIYVHPEEGEPQLYEVPAGKHLRVHEGSRARRRPPHRGTGEPARYLENQGPAGGAGVSAQRGPGGIPAAGREDQRQAHRRDRAPDAAEGKDRRARGHGVPGGGERGQADLLRREGPGREEGRQAPDQRAVAPGDHEGESHDAVVHLGGVVP